MSTDYSTLPAVPLTGVEPGTICERRNGSVCRFERLAGTVAIMSSDPAIWSQTGSNSVSESTPHDIVRIIRETPLPDGWRVENEWLVCGEEFAVKRSPDGQIAIAHRNMIESPFSDAADWLTCTPIYDTLAANMAAVDAAWAEHVAEQSKPVLVWDDSIPDCPTAAKNGVRYVVAVVTSSSTSGASAFIDGKWKTLYAGSFVVDAKAACERHAERLSAS